MIARCELVSMPSFGIPESCNIDETPTGELGPQDTEPYDSGAETRATQIAALDTKSE